MIDLPERFNAAAFFLDAYRAGAAGARTALRCAGRSVDYGALVARVDRASGALAGLGLQPEQRVLLALPDGPEFAEVFWGAIRLGAVAVPVNPALAVEDYAFLLADSRARVAVAAGPAVAALAAARTRTARPPALVAVGPGGAGAVDYEGALAAAAVPAGADTHRDDVALWGYTSGSTGRPKAALHLHHDLVYAADLVGQGVFGIRGEDRILSVSKLFFTYGLGNSLLFPARVGASSVLLPERPEPARVLDAIAGERVTLLFTVPTVYQRLLGVEDAERRWDLSSLRCCVSSGEALPPAVFHAWRARFGHELLDVIGSTEALHDFIANRPGLVRPGSIGLLVPGFEARVTDGDGRPVVPGAVGELWIKGESTSPGYWNRHAETKRTMVGEWLRTGDMVFQDTDGYFYMAGRTDDMVKVGGMWVSPLEVEGCLLEHPAVLEAAVIGRGDADGLTKPHAYCVLREGHRGEPELVEQLRQHVRRRLAGYKSPRWVDFVPELPRTPTGKIQRFRLRMGRG